MYCFVEISISTYTYTINVVYIIYVHTQTHTHTHICVCIHTHDFPGGSEGKASVYNARDPGLIPGWGRSPGEGNGNPLQYYCLENPMDRGA